MIKSRQKIRNSCFFIPARRLCTRIFFYLFGIPYGIGIIVIGRKSFPFIFDDHMSKPVPPARDSGKHDDIYVIPCISVFRKAHAHFPETASDFHQIGLQGQTEISRKNRVKGKRRFAGSESRSEPRCASVARNGYARFPRLYFYVFIFRNQSPRV